MQDATRKVGLDSEGSRKFPEYLAAQGYINLRDESFKWAIGGWLRGQKEKDIRKWMLESVLQGLSGVTMALFMRYLEWSREAVEIFLTAVRKQAMDPYRSLIPN